METSVPQLLLRVLMGRNPPLQKDVSSITIWLCDSIFLYAIRENHISVFQEIAQIIPEVYKRKNAGLTLPNM